jgi:dephospho-CoA kinase
MNVENKQPVEETRVVAVIGSIAAGKNELASYLGNQHAVTAVEVGQFARRLAETAEERDEEPLLRYETAAQTLAVYGSEHILRWLVAEIVGNDLQPQNPLVITGVRTPAEATVLKEQFGSDMLLVFVKVGDQKTRYERSRERGYVSDPDDFEDFLKQDNELKSTYALAATEDMADVILHNNGSRETFHRQIEAQVVPHLVPG